MKYEKDGQHLLEWENSDLTLGELFNKLEAAWEDRDPDLAEEIITEIQSRIAAVTA